MLCLPCSVTLCCVAALRRFTKCLQGWKQKLQDIGYDSIVFEDPLDMLLQQVQVRAGQGLPAVVHQLVSLALLEEH